MRVLVLLLALHAAACTLDTPGLCNTATDCPGGLRCKGGVCSGCDADAECGDDGVCGADHRCACAPGYEPHGVACVARDECHVDADCGHGECLENERARYCECDRGFKDDGTTCVEIDECAAKPCGAGTCIDGVGTYRCECPAGYQAANQTCEDVDECQSFPPPCGSPDATRCENQPGTYACVCNDGFVRDDATGTCVDVDECQATPGLCGALTCDNRRGTYVCRCPAGFASTDGSCVPVPRSEFQLPNGDVRTVLVDGNTLYFGGSFDFVGTPAPGFGVFLDSFGILSTPPALDLRHGRAVASDGQGGWFVAREVGAGEPGILHVRSDGTADPAFDVRGPMSPRALTVAGGLLWAIGTFDRGAAGIRSLLVFDLATGAEVTSLPVPDGECRAMVVDGPSLYVGGSFTSVGGAVRQGLAAYDVMSRTLTGWAPASGAVDTVAVAAGKVFVSGDLRPDASGASVDFASYDRATAAYVPWLPSMTGKPVKLLGAADRVYAAGPISAPNGSAVNHAVLAFDPTTAQPVPFPTDLAEGTKVADLVLNGSDLFVAGYLDRPFAGQAWGVENLKTRSQAWTAILGGPVAGIAKDGGKVALVGDFVNARGSTAFGVTSVGLDDAKPGSFHPVLLNDPPPASPLVEIDGIARQGQSVVVGGSFVRLQSLPHPHLVALSDSGNPMSWVPKTAPTAVTTLVSGGAFVYVAGDFPGAADEHLYAFDTSTGGQETALGVHGGVRALVVDGNTLYVAGTFADVAGQPRAGLAAFDVRTNALLPFAPALTNPPTAIAAKDGRVFVDGHALGDRSTRELDGVSGAVLSTIPLDSDHVTALLRVDDVLVQGDEAGVLQSVDVVSRESTPLHATFDARVSSLAAGGPYLVVGGAFETMNGAFHPHLAIFGR